MHYFDFHLGFTSDIQSKLPFEIKAKTVNFAGRTYCRSKPTNDSLVITYRLTPQTSVTLTRPSYYNSTMFARAPASSKQL